MVKRMIIKKILVVQFYQIGDVLLTTPLIRALKNEFPDAEIHFCANKLPSKLLENNPYISKIIINPAKSNEIIKSLKFYLSLKKENYDLVIDTLGTNGTAILSYLTAAKFRFGWDLRIRKMFYNIVIPRVGNCYSAKAKLEMMKVFSWNEYDSTPEIFLTEKDYQKVNQFWKENNFTEEDFIVVVSPFSRREARRWKLEYFAELCDLLVEKYNAKVILQYGPGEESYIADIIKRLKKQVYLDPKTNLRELAALLQKSSLFIGNDNGPKHIAVAVGTPTITIYGPTNPINWQPEDTKKHFSLQDENLPCIKCGARICPKDGSDKMKCMKNIKPQDVLEKVELVKNTIYPNNE